MPDYIATCLPNNVIMTLLGNSHLTIELFLRDDLPLMINEYKHEVVNVYLEALSIDSAVKILSWSHPDLFVVQVRNRELI